MGIGQAESRLGWTEEQGVQIRGGVKTVSQSMSTRVSRSISQSVVSREKKFRWKWRAEAIAGKRGAAGRVWDRWSGVEG